MKGQRALALVSVVFVAVALSLGLEALGELSGVMQFEDYTLDRRHTTTAESFLEGVGERESDIVLVLFDEYSVMDSLDGWPWISPFPRAHLAELVDAVSEAGARTIGLDVYLDRLWPRLGGDDELRGAMERAGNVVLVTPLVQTDSGPVSAAPHPYFADVAAGVGTAELPGSFETFRDGTLAVRSGEGLAPSFALSLYAHARGLDVDSILAEALERGRVDLPGLPAGVGAVDPEWFEASAETGRGIIPFRIRYVGPPSSPNAADQAGTFTALTSFSVPMAAMLTPERFQDKIVLLGTGFHEHDRFRTPFQGFIPPPDSTLTDPEPYGWMYGVEVHAHALQNMLDREYIRPLHGGAKLLLLIALAALTGWVTFRRGAWWGAVAVVASLFGVSVLAGWSWAGEVNVLGWEVVALPGRFLWLPVTVLILGSLLTYVGSIGYVSIVEGREKRYIKSAFGMYLSPDVVEEIADDPALLELGGQKRQLSLLFSDLSGFTSISEEMDAQDLVAILNEYLDEMTQLVLDASGYLDKYIGDAIMAFWNAPKEAADHADRAIRTAIAMQRRMDALNVEWAERNPAHEPLSVRIGLHTGEVVVGNVGGAERLNYSAIGDAVNLAARLEPANKDYGTLTMISEVTLAQASGRYRVRELDRIAVVGRDEGVTVYELIGEEGVPIHHAREEAVTLFERGHEAYRRRAWAEAKEYFDAAAAADPTDGPSRVYRQRCAEFVENPPPADWDFVVRRTKK